MRCASCGTENAPDSRFCGGCGARLSADPPAPRLAPTHKISDDARWDSAQPTSQAPIPQQVSRKHPGSAPPGTYQVPLRPPTNPVIPLVAPNSRPQPMSMPPASSAPRRDDIGRLATEVPPRAPTAPGQRSSGARISQPPPRASAKQLEPPAKRWGLIMLLVLIDLGLAAAGVVLLREGLREAPVPAPGSGSSTAAGGAAGSSAQAEPPKPAPPEPVVVVAPPPPVEVGSAATPPSPPPDPPLAAKSARTTKTHVTNRRAGSGAGSGPLDPYAGDAAEAAVNLTAQIDRLTAHSKPSFDACYTAVMKAMPPATAVHGAIKIAFRVVPDGRVERVLAIENTTGSEPLAGCLVNEIGSWVLPSHPGDPVDFVRAFTF